MELSVDGIQVFVFLDWQIKLLENYVQAESLKSDIKRRAIFSIEKPVHKHLISHSPSLKKKMKALGVKEFPSNPRKLSKLIASRDDMDLKKTSYPSGRSLDLNGEYFHTVPGCILTIVKSFIGNEDKYISDRIKWILSEKIDMSMKRMHFFWDHKLEERNIDIPIDDEEFAQLVFSQDNYNERGTKND